MKAILIIDMPKDCWECPCFMDVGWRCQCRMDIDEDVHDGRPEWCPLRKMNFLKMSYDGYVFYNRQWLKDHIKMEASIIKGEINDHQERSKRV